MARVLFFVFSLSQPVFAIGRAQTLSPPTSAPLSAVLGANGNAEKKS